MNGPTIQQLKQQGGDSLWQFLSSLPSSMEAQILYGLMLAGIVGMSAHYFMKWLQGDITGDLFRYLFLDYPKRTALAYAGVVGAALAAISSNVFSNDQGQFVGWLNVLWIGLTNGYAADSIANKGRGANGSSGDPAMVSIQPAGKGPAGPGAAIISALALGMVLALGAPAEARAQVGNLQSTILPSAARTAAQVNSADQNNLTWGGVTVIVNVTSFTAGTYTPKIQGKDPVSGNYYDILTGTAIGATGTFTLKVYPGITAAANASVSDMLPRVWRVQLNGATGQSMTFSVGANLQQ